MVCQGRNGPRWWSSLSFPSSSQVPQIRIQGMGEAEIRRRIGTDTRIPAGGLAPDRVGMGANGLEGLGTIEQPQRRHGDRQAQSPDESRDRCANSSAAPREPGYRHEDSRAFRPLPPGPPGCRGRPPTRAMEGTGNRIAVRPGDRCNQRSEGSMPGWVSTLPGTPHMVWPRKERKEERKKEKREREKKRKHCCPYAVFELAPSDSPLRGGFANQGLSVPCDEKMNTAARCRGGFHYPQIT